jgi:hypothetical protein
MKLKTVSEVELFEYLDDINEISFEYVGVMYLKSGYRPEVEKNKEFINLLEAIPLRRMKIKNSNTKKRIDLDNFMIINLAMYYVNIYLVNDVKHKLKGISKQQCCVKLRYID